MTAQLAPLPVFRGWDNLGFPLVSGKLFTFAAGTTTPISTYVDSTLTTQNTNPIILNFRGECNLWLDPSFTYKFTLNDALGNLIWTVDHIAVSGAGSYVLDVRSFFVVGNNIVDDTAALQAALNSLPPGSTAVIANGLILRIAGNLTIPPNITLKGPQSYVGTMTSNSMNAPYQTMGGQISLSSSATITMSAGSCIDGLLILQHGLTFPQTDPSNYAGTAITYAGDDCTVRNSMILGFNQAITSTGFQRPHIFDCLMDNNNGIAITNSSDLGSVDRVHMWPFGTFYAGVTAVNIQRSGVGFSFLGGGSGSGASTDCVECFAFGYQTGFLTGGTGDAGQVFLKCWADNTATGFGTGFSITGGSTDTKLTACQASGAIQGYFVSNFTGLNITLTDCNSWGHSNHGLLCASANTGNITVRGGIYHTNGSAITYADTGGGALDIDDVTFDNTNSVILTMAVSSTSVHFRNNNNFTNVGNGTQLTSNLTNLNVPTLPSATVLNLPPTGDDFIVSGTTSIGSINFGWPGRQVTLYFSGICQVGNSTTGYSNIRLSGAANYTSTAGGSLTVRHNGVQWYEIGRSA